MDAHVCTAGVTWSNRSSYEWHYSTLELCEIRESMCLCRVPVGLFHAWQLYVRVISRMSGYERDAPLECTHQQLG